MELSHENIVISSKLIYRKLTKENGKRITLQKGWKINQKLRYKELIFKCVMIDSKLTTDCKETQRYNKNGESHRSVTLKGVKP